MAWKIINRVRIRKALKELKNPDMPNFKIKAPNKIPYKIRIDDTYTNPEYKNK